MNDWINKWPWEREKEKGVRRDREKKLEDRTGERQLIWEILFLKKKNSLEWSESSNNNVLFKWNP